MRNIIAVFFFIMSAALSGCASLQNAPTDQPILPSSSPSSTPAPAPPRMTLYGWWQDYIYDAVYTLQSDYPSMIQYDTGAMIEYCGIHMYREGKIRDAGKGAAGGSGQSLLPKKLLGEYMLRYFNVPLSKLDTLKLETDDGASISYYLPVGEDPAGSNPADESLNKNDVFTLTDAQDNPDGTATLTVERDDGLITNFIMAPRQDGYYIKEVRQDWGPKSESIQIQGKFICTDTLLGMDGRHGIGSLYGCGEIDGSVLLEHHYMYSSIVTLSLVSTTDLSETMHEIRLAKDEEFLSAQADETRITVLTSKRIITMGAGFSNQTERELPETFISLFPGGMPVYDLSADMQRVVYANSEGIALYDFSANTEKLLARHPNYNPSDTGKEVMGWVTYGKVSFISNDTQVEATIYGYEHTAGRFVYDLETGEAATFDAVYGYFGSPVIIDGKAVAFFRTNSQGDPDFAPHIWMDVESGEIHPLELPPGLQYILPAASKSSLLLLGNEGNSRMQLYSLNLDSMLIEKQDFTFAGAGEDPLVICATENGKLLLVYYSFEGGTGEYILAN